MKTLLNFLHEAKSTGLPDDFDEQYAVWEFKKYAPKYEKEIKRFFPKDWNVRVQAEKILGNVVTFSVTSPWKVTRHNANAIAEFMVQLSDSRGRNFVRGDKLSATKLQLSRGMKYRKISATDPEALLKKVTAWYKKNAKNLIEIEEGKQ